MRDRFLRRMVLSAYQSHLGPPDYAHRNHYMEAQWIPDSLKKGWIEEETRAVAGTATERVTTQLTPAPGGRQSRPGESCRSYRPLGTFSVDLIPLARVTELAPRIPEGTVLFVLRESRPWRPFNVSHAGVVVAGQRGERYLRHASDVPRVLRVRDEPLERFLARNARYQGWRVIGVALFTIRDNSQRASELVGRAAQEPREQPIELGPALCPGVKPGRTPGPVGPAVRVVHQGAAPIGVAVGTAITGGPPHRWGALSVPRTRSQGDAHEWTSGVACCG